MVKFKYIVVSAARMLLGKRLAYCTGAFGHEWHGT